METTYYSEIEDTTTLADGLVGSGLGGVSEYFHHNILPIRQHHTFRLTMKMNCFLTLFGTLKVQTQF